MLSNANSERMRHNMAIISGWSFRHVGSMQLPKGETLLEKQPLLLRAPKDMTQNDTDEMLTEIRETYSKFDEETYFKGEIIVCFSRKSAALLAAYSFEVEDFAQRAQYLC